MEIKNRDVDLENLNLEVGDIGCWGENKHVQIQMQLRVFDEKKRKQYRFKENEGLQFAFDIENDTAEEVVQQMIEQQHIPDEDMKMITKLIKDKVDGFKRDRDFRLNEMQRQRDEEARLKEEQEIKEELKARQCAKEKAEREALEQQNGRQLESQLSTDPAVSASTSTGAAGPTLLPQSTTVPVTLNLAEDHQPAPVVGLYW